MSEAANLSALYQEAFPLDEAAPWVPAIVEGPEEKELKSLKFVNIYSYFQFHISSGLVL